MAVFVTDPTLEKRLKVQREVSGADRYDEVWEGIYMMAPMPNDEHQQLVMRLASIFQETIGWPAAGEVRAGVNVSEREQGWEQEYRVPDIAVFLSHGRARNCGTHWCGGPDFLVKITNPGDRTREKLPFYSRIGSQELLIVDRQTWTLELYQPQSGQLQQVGQSRPDTDVVLTSSQVGFAFQLLPDRPHPLIEVTHVDSQRTWLV